MNSEPPSHEILPGLLTGLQPGKKTLSGNLNCKRMGILGGCVGTSTASQSWWLNPQCLQAARVSVMCAAVDVYVHSV